MNKFLIAFLPFLMYGCSTVPIDTTSGNTVPDNLIYKKDLVYKTNDDTKGTITIFRDAGFLGSGCSFDVNINDQKIFSIRPKQFLKLQLEPNEYILKIVTGGGLCPNTQLTYDVNLKAKSDLEYRISINSNGQMMFTRQK